LRTSKSSLKPLLRDNAATSGLECPCRQYMPGAAPQASLCSAHTCPCACSYQRPLQAFPRKAAARARPHRACLRNRTPRPEFCRKYTTIPIHIPREWAAPTRSAKGGRRAVEQRERKDFRAGAGSEHCGEGRRGRPDSSGPE
jgi:hypothetical protein